MGVEIGGEGKNVKEMGIHPTYFALKVALF